MKKRLKESIFENQDAKIRVDVSKAISEAKPTVMDKLIEERKK